VTGEHEVNYVDGAITGGTPATFVGYSCDSLCKCFNNLNCSMSTSTPTPQPTAKPTLLPVGATYDPTWWPTPTPTVAPPLLTTSEIGVAVKKVSDFNEMALLASTVATRNVTMDRIAVIAVEYVSITSYVISLGSFTEAQVQKAVATSFDVADSDVFVTASSTAYEVEIVFATIEDMISKRALLSRTGGLSQALGQVTTVQTEVATIVRVIVDITSQGSTALDPVTSSVATASYVAYNLQLTSASDVVVTVKDQVTRAAPTPAPEGQMPLGVLETRMTKRAQKHSNVLEIASSTQFAVGDAVRLESIDGSLFEYKRISSFGSIILEDPLEYSYAAGARVIQVCGVNSCAWMAAEWSACSTTCGYGVRSRNVECPIAGQCVVGLVPEVEAPCMLGPCAWTTSDWGECNAPCGSGERMRTIECPGNAQCSGSRPEDKASCNTQSCIWAAGNWSNCDRECGGGISTRNVSCPVEEACGEEPTVTMRCNEQLCGNEAMLFTMIAVCFGAGLIFAAFYIIRPQCQRKNLRQPVSRRDSSGKTCKYHLFVATHDEYKHLARNIETALREIGFKVWSAADMERSGSAINVNNIGKGVEDSAAVLLLMARGLFHSDQRDVWKTELKHAIELGKPIIAISNGFKFDETFSDCGHLREVCWPQSCGGKRPAMDITFQPYARAIVRALEVIEWNPVDSERVTSFTDICLLKDIKEKYFKRKLAVKKLEEHLQEEKSKGVCYVGKAQKEREKAIREGDTAWFLGNPSETPKALGHMSAAKLKELYLQDGRLQTSPEVDTTIFNTKVLHPKRTSSHFYLSDEATSLTRESTEDISWTVEMDPTCTCITASLTRESTNQADSGHADEPEVECCPDSEGLVAIERLRASLQEDNDWSCPHCTMRNSWHKRQCVACDVLRPKAKRLQFECCSNCRKPCTIDAAFCDKCGQDLKQRERCIKCGAGVLHDGHFCNLCGTRRPSNSQSKDTCTASSSQISRYAQEDRNGVHHLQWSRPQSEELERQVVVEHTWFTGQRDQPVLNVGWGDDIIQPISWRDVAWQDLWKQQAQHSDVSETKRARETVCRGVPSKFN